MKKHKVKVKATELIGYVIAGEALIDLWGGGSGTITMDKAFLPVEHFTKDNVLRCVNDGGFGCENIRSADIDITEKYDNGGFGKSITVHAVTESQSRMFLGWPYLKTLEGVRV